MTATLAFNARRRRIYLLSSTVVKRKLVAHLSNMDTKSRVVVSCKRYILYCACSLSLPTSYLLDIPQTAVVLTPIFEGLDVDLLLFSAYRERPTNDFGQSSAKQRVKPIQIKLDA